MFLLDTNICIYLIRRRPERVFERLTQASTAGEAVAISVISAFELEVGALRAQGQRYGGAVQRFIAAFEVLPLDDTARVAYGRLRTGLERRGQSIGPHDLLIAAHALAREATLVTNNEREFRRVKGLRIENWAA